MNIYRSNSTEVLLDTMAQILSEPLESVFEPECIVVQSKGMAAWLNMGLSERFGVWANSDFPHPRQLIQRIFRATLGQEGEQIQQFNRQRLTFAVHTLLPDFLDDPCFAPLNRYLEQGELRKSLQLAQRIAYIFDQYVVYRPEMIRAWDKSKEPAEDLGQECWQPKLWRALSKHLGAWSPAELLLKAHEKAYTGEFIKADLLPKRVCLFGIAGLPPVYLSLISALAKTVPVHFFLHAPCEAFWADILPQAEIDKIAALQGSDDLQYYEAGHPLLASLGSMGRDFQLMLEESASYYEPFPDLFVGNEHTSTMLASLQRDILELNHRPTYGDLQNLTIDNRDRSITLHSCHSPLRELEVLQDQLLDIFSDNTHMQPRDIVVMLPDVESYAPLIDAVFDRRPDDPRFIPYNVADRSALAEFSLIDAFLKILLLCQGRFAAPDVVELLEFEAIRMRFGIRGKDLPMLRTWVAQSGIRWGINESHRQKHQQPKERQNTWQFGFDRLFLGFAMRTDSAEFCGNILPYPEIEGQGAEVLGCFAHFCEALFDTSVTFEQEQNVSAWQQTFFALIDTFFNPESPDAWQLQKLRDVIDEIASEAEDGGFVGNLDVDSIYALIYEKVAEPGNARGFLTGGVTFCAMLPMRSIPFKVVAILGLNDGVYPRQEYPYSFDLLARHPRLGDRSKRNDDRYIFLEALLAAQERILISYVGHDVQDGSAMPPSVVVEELVDCLAQSYAADGTEDEISFDQQREIILSHLLTVHPLQPYSRHYFDKQNNRLFSYAKEFCEAALLQGQGDQNTVKRFLARPLVAKAPAELPQDLSLEALMRFFNLPIRSFMQNKLHLFFREDEEEMPDREPIALSPLEKYTLGKELLAQGPDVSDHARLLLKRWQGQGLLPLAAAAESSFSDIHRAVQPVVELAKSVDLKVATTTTLSEIVLPCGVVVQHEVNGEPDQGAFFVSNAKVSAKAILSLWLEHLFVSCLVPAGCQSHLAGRAERNRAQLLRFQNVANPAEILEELFHLFSLGWQEPLLFFPQTSYDFAHARINGRGDDEKRLQAARKKAYATYFGGGFTHSFAEGDNPYLARFFASANPLEQDFLLYDEQTLSYDFESLSLQIFTPILEHMEKVA